MTGLRPGNKPALMGSGRYLLTERLDHGGVAGVYLAYDRQTKVWRAIKVLSPEYMADTAARARFEREAQVTTRIAHPHLVRTMAVHDDATSSYMVMELAQGGTASGWLERFGPMPARLAAHVALQVCEALSAAHAGGVAHHDLTPANVLFDLSGSVKLGNFHFAHGDTTGDSGLMPDVSEDVQGVGRLVYSLATGHTPSEGQTLDTNTLPEPLADVVRGTYDGAIETIDALADALDQAVARLDRVPEGTPSLADAPIHVPDAPPSLDDEEVIDYRSSSGSPAGSRYDQPYHRGLTPAGMPPRTAPPALIETPSPAPAASRGASPSAVPYRMPPRPKRSQREEIERRLAAERERKSGRADDDGDPQPDWVVATPAPAKERDYIITPAVASSRITTPAPSGLRRTTPRRATPRRPTPRGATPRGDAPGPRVVEDPVMGEVLEDAGIDEEVPDRLDDVVPREATDEDEDDGVLTTALMAAGVLALVLPLVLGIGIYLGSLSVTEAQVDATRHQADFYSTIESQHDVIRDIADLGGDSRVLEQAYFAYDDATDATRRALALKFVDTLSTVWDETPRGAKSAQVAERVRAIRGARRDYERSFAAWANAASNPLGASAVLVGLAEAPDP